MTSGTDGNKRRCPIWMDLAIIACMAPVLAFPFLLHAIPSDNPTNMLSWFYPLYVIASGLCARICYPERKEMTWILLVLALLSHAAIWILAFSPE